MDFALVFGLFIGFFLGLWAFQWTLPWSLDFSLDFTLSLSASFALAFFLLDFALGFGLDFVLVIQLCLGFFSVDLSLGHLPSPWRCCFWPQTCLVPDLGPAVIHLHSAIQSKSPRPVCGQRLFLARIQDRSILTARRL